MIRLSARHLLALSAVFLPVASCSRHDEPIEGAAGATSHSGGTSSGAGRGSATAQAQSAPSRPAATDDAQARLAAAAKHAAKLSDTSAPVRTVAAAALVKAGPDAGPLVIEQVRGGNMHVVAAASRILSDMGPGVVPLLRGTVSDPNDDVRMVSIWALMELGQSSLPALAELSAARDDANPKVKYLAIQAVKVVTNDQTDVEVDRRAREEAERRRDGK